MMCDSEQISAFHLPPEHRHTAEVATSRASVAWAEVEDDLEEISEESDFDDDDFDDDFEEEQQYEDEDLDADLDDMDKGSSQGRKNDDDFEHP